MIYKGLEWVNISSDLIRMETKFIEFTLSVFRKKDSYTWCYEIFDSKENQKLSDSGYDSMEAAMREAIFDAMGLKLRDSH